MIAAGERRWRAHERLGKQTIFAILLTGILDELAIIENLQRENLNPLDEAEALGSLIRSGMVILWSSLAGQSVNGKAR